MLPTAEMVESGLRPTQQRFIDALYECGSITEAASRIGIDRQSHYDWLESEKSHGLDISDDGAPAGSYAYAFSRAKRIAADRILEKSVSHALSDDRDMPATVNRFFHIKRWFPEYREQQTINVKGTIWHANVDLGTLSDADRAQLLSLAAERATLRLNPAPDTPPTDE